MYRSKHNSKVPPSFSTFGFHGTSKVLGNVEGTLQSEKIPLGHPSKKQGATFGRAVGITVNPKLFLKKTDQSLPGQSEFHRSGVIPTKANVPTREERPVMGLTTDKNFVVSNAVENILAVPKKVQAQTARAVDRNTFAKVPKYLVKAKEELADRHRKAEEEAARQLSSQSQQDMQEMSPAELQELQESLLGRWEVLSKQFRCMSLNLETRAQLRRKEKLESDIRAIEVAMRRLNNKTHVLILNED